MALPAAIPLAVQLAPAAAAVVGTVFNWLSGKSQANAQKAYNNLTADLHNKWLATRDTQVKGILDELKARGQDLYGPSVTTSTGSSTSNQTTNYSDEETPTLSPEYQNLANLQKSLVERRLSSPTGLPAGYEQAGIGAINQSAQAGLNDIDNLARSRGLSADVLKIGNPAERSRLQQIAQFRVETPLKARALQTEDLGIAESLLQKWMGRKRKGTSNTRGSTNQTQTTTGPADYSAIANLVLSPGPQAAKMA